MVIILHRLIFVASIIVLISVVLIDSEINFKNSNLLMIRQAEAEGIMFEDVTEFAGIVHFGNTYGSSWGDLNGDSWPDLWQGNHGFHGNGSKIFINNKNGTFSEFKSLFNADSIFNKDNHAATWADFDNDGDQDLLILVGAQMGYGEGPNTFLINENGSLIDRATEYGLDYSLGRGRTPLWFDWDNDGLLDILLTNGQRPDKKSPTKLFHQSSEGFEGIEIEQFKKIVSIPSVQVYDVTLDGKLDIILLAGTPNEIYDMKDLPPKNIRKSLDIPKIDSIDWAIADFNGDLQPDFFLLNGEANRTNYYSQKVQIPSNQWNENKIQIVNEPPACRSLVTGDFDNDMDLDIYLVCTITEVNENKKFRYNLPNVLYENVGGGNFISIPHAGGAEGTILGMGQSVSLVDYDNDGFLDIYVTNGENDRIPKKRGPSQLFRNLGNNYHWLEIDLVGTASNRDSIGSKVFLNIGNISQVRDQVGGVHYLSQNHQRIHFGMGENSQADSIIVYWPSGIVQGIENVSSDQILKILEPPKSISPKKQNLLGINFLEVKCNKGLQLVLKSSYDTSACVTPETAQKLIKRGWAN